METRNGPTEIFLGDGPGPDRQVADPFQKYWECTFANQVCELAPKKQNLSRLENIDHLLGSVGRPIKNLRDLQGDSLFHEFPNTFGRGVFKFTMAPCKSFRGMVQDLIGKLLIHFRNIVGALLPMRSVSLHPPKKKCRGWKI